MQVFNKPQKFTLLIFCFLNSSMRSQILVVQQVRKVAQGLPKKYSIVLGTGLVTFTSFHVPDITDLPRTFTNYATAATAAIPCF